MRIVDHAALESYSVAGIEHRTLAAARDGLEDLEVWDDLLYPGAATRACRHDCDKVVLVFAGAGELDLDGERREFVAPCSLIVPRGLLHTIRNNGDRAVALVTVFGASPFSSFGADGGTIDLPWSSAVSVSAPVRR